MWGKVGRGVGIVLDHTMLMCCVDGGVNGMDFDVE